MTRHIVFWNHADGYTTEQKLEHAREIKESLEQLKSRIDGIVSIKVIVSPLDSGNVDMMLDSVFENEQALSAYQVHPEHQKAAAFVRNVTKDRKCFDYEVYE